MACFSEALADVVHSNHSIMRTAYLLVFFFAARLSLGFLLDDAGRVIWMAVLLLDFMDAKVNSW